MRYFVLSAYISLVLILPGHTAAQTTPEHPTAHALVPCGDSPTPGKRPMNMDCAVLARKQFTVLPKGPLVLRLENFLTIEAAQQAGTPASAVVEAAGKVWLLTLGSKGERSQGGNFVTEIGPIPAVPQAPRYEIQVSEANFGPEMNALVSKAVHTHSGPEIWYLFTGEQCLETPNGTVRARAGEGMFAPAETPMQLNFIGPSKRDALFIIVHDSAQPATTVSNWMPKGTCQK